MTESWRIRTTRYVSPPIRRGASDLNERVSGVLLDPDEREPCRGGGEIKNGGVGDSFLNEDR